MIDKKFLFSESNLTKAANDTGKRLILFDTKRPGLALRISPTGTKTFCYMAWDQKRGRSVDITIGGFPKMRLKDARDKAVELSGLLSDGADLRGQVQADRQEPTLTDAFERWVKKKSSRGRTSHTSDRLRYNKHIRPIFGTRRVSDITTKQLEHWFLSLPKKSGISTTSANRILVIIRTIYNQELSSYPNPCNGISLYQEESRDRFLRPAELPVFFTELDSRETPHYLRDFVYLALYTGARKSNLLGMRWADIDFDLGVWTIPASQSKNRATMTLPLIPATLEILERRWRENQGLDRPSTFVFPTLIQSKSGHLADIRDSWGALLKRAGIDDFRMHDLRRSLGSWQTITGASTAVVGKSLGHKSQQATAIYSRMHLDPVRQSIERAVEAMRKIEPKVVPLKSATGGKK